MPSSTQRTRAQNALMARKKPELIRLANALHATPKSSKKDTKDTIVKRILKLGWTVKIFTAGASASAVVVGLIYLTRRYGGQIAKIKKIAMKATEATEATEAARKGSSKSKSTSRTRSSPGSDSRTLEF